MRERSYMTHSRLLGIPVLILAAGALVAGCGGGGAASDSSAPSTPVDANPAAVASLGPEEALLKFTSCMREHGIDMPEIREWKWGSTG